MKSGIFCPFPSSSIAIYIIGVVIFTSSVSQACFIRNCPKGGKRSMDAEIVPKRECMRCGLDGLGQCVGPSICCSPQFGCHIGTREALVCQHEDDSTTPCMVTGSPCGAQDSGKCVADGICCDSDSCGFNERCRQRSSSILDRKTQPNGNILHLLQKLLEVRDYE